MLWTFRDHSAAYRYTYWLSVISARRPENADSMSKLIGAATWYTDPESASLYEAHGLSVRPTFGLSAARNLAIQEAEKHDAVCVQIDDDLRWMGFARNKKVIKSPSTHAVIQDLVKRLTHSDFYLGGVSPTDNAYFARKRNSSNLFIVGSCCAIKPGSGLYFSTELKLKEDYDYTCQHIARYGGVCRCDDLLASFRHYSNSGGAVDVRSEFTEQQAVHYLLEHWPGWIKKHPRRSNEVLLRVPRKRELLT
jgi:glycosyltransferase involved in cell wall biosynthesis